MEANLNSNARFQIRTPEEIGKLKKTRATQRLRKMTIANAAHEAKPKAIGTATSWLKTMKK